MTIRHNFDQSVLLETVISLNIKIKNSNNMYYFILSVL